MARIFNIYFTYGNTQHNAMVSVRTTPFFTEYTLNFDEEMMQLLPGNKIISSSPDHFIFQHTAPENSSPLMEEIIRAVAQHMQTSEV